MPFKKGQSGNPAGKPVGTKDWRSALRSELERNAPKVIKQLVKSALDGDVQASKILIDRVFPPLRAAASPVALQLPETDALGKAEAVFSAALEGKITPAELSELLGALAALLKVKEATELESRLDEIEANMKSRENMVVKVIYESREDKYGNGEGSDKES